MLSFYTVFILCFPSDIKLFGNVVPLFLLSSVFLLLTWLVLLWVFLLPRGLPRDLASVRMICFCSYTLSCSWYTPFMLTLIVWMSDFISFTSWFNLKNFSFCNSDQIAYLWIISEELVSIACFTDATIPSSVSSSLGLISKMYWHSTSFLTHFNSNLKSEISLILSFIALDFLLSKTF